MTRRERLEARAERRREWAQGRDQKAGALLKQNERFRGDVAFNTQPGHIPERARAIARSDRACEHAQMADHHQAKAAGIEHQLDRSIFSDDPDAVEALEAKAADLDRKADRRKAVNAAFRKAQGADNAAKLAALEAAGIITKNEAHALTLGMAGCHWETQPFPAYMLTNARANARRLRERIKAIQSQAARTAEADAAGGVTVKLVGPMADHACITFAEYPGRDTVNALKAAGFWWSRPSWHGPASKLPADLAALAS